MSNQKSHECQVPQSAAISAAMKSCIAAPASFERQGLTNWCREVPRCSTDTRTCGRACAHAPAHARQCEVPRHFAALCGTGYCIDCIQFRSIASDFTKHQKKIRSLLDPSRRQSCAGLNRNSGVDKGTVLVSLHTTPQPIPESEYADRFGERGTTHHQRSRKNDASVGWEISVTQCSVALVSQGPQRDSARIRAVWRSHLHLERGYQPLHERRRCRRQRSESSSQPCRPIQTGTGAATKLQRVREAAHAANRRSESAIERDGCLRCQTNEVTHGSRLRTAHFNDPSLQVAASTTRPATRTQFTHSMVSERRCRYSAGVLSARTSNLYHAFGVDSLPARTAESRIVRHRSRGSGTIRLTSWRTARTSAAIVRGRSGIIGQVKSVAGRFSPRADVPLSAGFLRAGVAPLFTPFRPSARRCSCCVALRVSVGQLSARPRCFGSFPCRCLFKTDTGTIRGVGILSFLHLRRHCHA